MVVEASIIYTLKVFQLFCELKEESEFYRAFEMNDGSGYMIVHYHLEKVQRWCK
jgi:hypothetical protein